MAESAATPARTLTPYDTGRRGEARPWPVRSLTNLPPLERELEEDRYGKVDFDNDESNTLVTVWIELTAAGEHVVHIQEHTAEVMVKVHS